ncbi:MAG: TlpA family protein disulfide reductase, partial [Candidatus Heimdallarchaeota archaeon]|nr:TlpA family protein disulfide reductase [Candidatus Heimdallarchaeota archaeon]MCK4877868.1 TlpA family protein disulfide reductase [Candidatus Heimdallarchaeota archaeon]
MLQKGTLLIFFLLLVPFSITSFIGDFSEAYYNSEEQSKTNVIEQQAPDFTVQDVDSGSSSYLSDFRGRVVVLDLFATWCTPCKVALPYLREIYTEYSDNIVQIISIDIDNSESQSLVSQFRKDENMDWIVSLDPGGSINSAYGTETIPTFYIIDQQGEIQWSATGFSAEETWPEMERRIKNLVDGNSGNNQGSTTISRTLIIIAEILAGITGVIGIVYFTNRIRSTLAIKKCINCNLDARSKCSK